MNILRTVFLLISFSTSFAQITDFLRVEGRDVVNEQDEIVKLRGINIDAEFWAWDWDTTRHNNYADASDIRFLDSLGANVIRLCLNYQYFESEDGFNFIDNYLAWCDTAGIYVLLDMHVVPQGNDIFFNAIAQRELIDTWQSIALEYRDREVVLGYDLMNEPWPADSSLWYDFANRLVDSIRVVDSTHIIMVENTLAGEVFEMINEPNILYSYHDYSPFVVTHAAADWAGDSRVPSDYAYPGEVLSGTNWESYSEDQPYWDTNSPGWRYWDSGNLIVPPGAEYAYVKPNVYGNVGTVYFDDLGAIKNGVPDTVYNADIEEASWLHPGQPTHWTFFTSGSHSGAWSSVAHGGSRSLSISGTADGYGVWGQGGWILIEPYISVEPGDTLRATGWILANTLNGGGVSIGYDYMSTYSENYDRQHLRDDIARYVNWSAANNKTIWCGEFGCMSAAPDESQERLVRDKIAIMNEAGLGWAMWSYRSQNPPPSFTLFYVDSVDVPLTNVITRGFAGETWPEAVRDLTISHDNSNVILRWSPVIGAVSYTVMSSPVSTNDLTQYTIVDTTPDTVYVQTNGVSAPRLFYVVVVTQ